jgi:hypothetical protein
MNASAGTDQLPLLALFQGAVGQAWIPLDTNIRLTLDGLHLHFRIKSSRSSSPPVPTSSRHVASAGLPVDQVILDGEIPWDPPPPDGCGGAGLHSGYHVFDILWLNGQLVTSLPLEDRRRLLQELPLKPPLRRVELPEDADPRRGRAACGSPGGPSRRISRPVGGDAVGVAGAREPRRPFSSARVPQKIFAGLQSGWSTRRRISVR